MRKKYSLVTLGGGSGHYTLLSGLKDCEEFELSAIVSMADDGGSTGVLRDSYGVLPPGDIRQCLVALSDSEFYLRELFNYRYSHGPFQGHSFGNIFLSTLERISGSFKEAVKRAESILNCKGKVIPVSEQNMKLVIKLKDGSEKIGERHLDTDKDVKEIGVESVSLTYPVKANEDALCAIEKADAIVMGPGDIYGSILPNLFVKEVAKAVEKSNAKLIFVANLTNKKGISDFFAVCDYVELIKRYTREPDCVLVNNAKFSKKALDSYIKQEGEGALVEKCRDGACKVCEADMLLRSSDFIRHDSKKLAKAIRKALKGGS